MGTMTAFLRRLAAFIAAAVSAGNARLYASITADVFALAPEPWNRRRIWGM